MAERQGRIVTSHEYWPTPRVHSTADFTQEPDQQCPKCGADLDDGECEECERSAPLDFDQ